MGKRRRNVKIRRSHLKPFSSSMINTGRGPNQQVLGEYSARARAVDERTLAEYGFNEPYFELITKSRQVGTRESYGKLIPVYMDTKVQFKVEHADMYQGDATSPHMSEFTPKALVAKRTLILAKLAEVEAEVEQRITLIDTQIKKVIMCYKKGKQKCFLTEHNKVTMRLSVSSEYSTSKVLIDRYKTGKITWREVQDLTQLNPTTE